MPDAPALEVRDLTVRFGGRTAVESLSLSAAPGRITGLIGPNGAGKTTTFNVCSGLLAATSGSIRLDGEDVTKETPQRRAQRGLGRTFQRMELFDSMSVRDNIGLGLESRLAGNRPWGHLRAPRHERARIASAADEAISRCGLDGLVDRFVGGLSTGQRRLVELARAIAGGFDLLLLDEPSSGLDPRETDELGELLRGLSSDDGVGILLVEHDMDLVMSCCEQIYVIDFGRLIFSGTAPETQSSPIVRAAYLGADA